MRKAKEGFMQRNFTRSATIAAILLIGLGSFACGGGGGNAGGGGGGGGMLTAVFTPANPAPGANSVSMAAGAVTGDTFQIVINATDINNFFGTGFRVSFDDLDAEFRSFDNSGSWLLTNVPTGATTNINASVDSVDPGVVVVNATFQGMTAGVNLTGTQELLTLTFRAIAVSGSNPFTFDGPTTRVVTVCTTMTGACTDQAVSWDGGTQTAQ
jgi:hypothetical protein